MPFRMSHILKVEPFISFFLQKNETYKITSDIAFDFTIQRIVPVYYSRVLLNPDFKIIVDFRERWEPKEIKTREVLVFKNPDAITNGLSMILEEEFPEILEAEISYVCKTCADSQIVCLICTTKTNTYNVPIT